MPASGALIGFDPVVQELLEVVVADEGYAVGAASPDVVLVEAGAGFAARPLVEHLADPVVLLTTALVARAPPSVRAKAAGRWRPVSAFSGTGRCTASPSRST
jgi:hypothetical protein